MTESFSQLASTSAVLGGFAFAFLGAVISGSKQSRAISFTAGFTLPSAACFILSAVGWSLFAVVMHNPAAPEKLPENLLSLHFLLSASFLLGILTFFCALGASGWIYSRKLGYTSSIVSITAGILTIYVISRFVVIQ